MFFHATFIRPRQTKFPAPYIISYTIKTPEGFNRLILSPAFLEYVALSQTSCVFWHNGFSNLIARSPRSLIGFHWLYANELRSSKPLQLKMIQ